MKKFLLATVSIVALSSVARAADLPAAVPTKERMYVPVPLANWAGGYVGLEGGVARRKAQGTEFLGIFDTTFSRDGSKTGGAAGALAGYNWQQGSFVYGVEGDWNWTGAKATGSDVNFSSISFDTNWLATVRARVGLAADSTLFYLTGGAAFAHVNNSLRVSADGPGGVLFSFTQNQTKAGWTVGAGVEHMLTPNWTARAEFRYVDLGKTTVDCTPAVSDCPTGYRGEFSNKLMLGLVGLAYKF